MSTSDLDKIARYVQLAQEHAAKGRTTLGFLQRAQDLLDPLVLALAQQRSEPCTPPSAS